MKMLGCAVLLAMLMLIAGCGTSSVTPPVGSNEPTLVVAFSLVGPDGSGPVLPEVGGVTVTPVGNKISPLVYSSNTGDPGGMAVRWSIVCPDGHTMYRTPDELPLHTQYVGSYTFVADYQIDGKVYHPQGVLLVQ